MYTPDRLALIAKEAAKEGSVFSLDDRLGLINDVMALSKAGQAKLSSALTLIDSWRGEKECKVLRLPSSSDETAEAMDILFKTWCCKVLVMVSRVWFLSGGSTPRLWTN